MSQECLFCRCSSSVEPLLFSYAYTVVMDVHIAAVHNSIHITCSCCYTYIVCFGYRLHMNRKKAGRNCEPRKEWRLFERKQCHMNKKRTRVIVGVFFFLYDVSLFMPSKCVKYQGRCVEARTTEIREYNETCLMRR